MRKPGILKIYADNKKDIEKFLRLFYMQDIVLENKSYYELSFENPIHMLDILSSYADNSDKFDINLWISLDTDIYILITETNINEINKYILERYPLD